LSCWSSLCWLSGSAGSTSGSGFAARCRARAWCTPANLCARIAFAFGHFCARVRSSFALRMCWRGLSSMEVSTINIVLIAGRGHVFFLLELGHRLIDRVARLEPLLHHQLGGTLHVLAEEILDRIVHRLVGDQALLVSEVAFALGR
jgi:hypothetical protein